MSKKDGIPCAGGKDGKPCKEEKMSYTKYCKKHYIEVNRNHVDAIALVLLEEIKDKL